LQRQQAMLARTEGIAHVGSWEWEIATDTVTWSEELFRIFQRDPREGAPSFADHPAFYHPDDIAHAQQAVEAAVAQGTPYELELRAIRKDGETRVVVARGIAEMSPGGRAVRLFGSLQDITSHKRAEEALQESEEQYRILFETMTEGVVLISPDGQILHANPAAERILRLTRSEMEGRQYDGPGWALLRPDGGALPPEDVAGSFTKEKIRPLKDVEIGFKHADGSFSWVTVNATPLLDQAGKLKSVVGTFRDITEREQLKRETARKITSELTAGIAHQIRNPLFVISLSVQSIEKKLSTKDPQRRLTQAILDKVHKLDEVTASLVHLGKYHRLLITNASLRKCLEQALILVRAPAKVQRVKVVRHYYPNLPRAWIDVEAMDEVFANLLTNALEAMPEGGLLTVETDLDVERKELLVRIQDDGCGIPKAAQENIFIPFSTTKESGSGLGLVFCQRIVEEHGGRLTFYSEAEGEDHGTTFQITLPVSHAALGRRE
ncbi:MAG: PAS domain S-box protein, partial [bacterium]